jgi:hypothetical protein
MKFLIDLLIATGPYLLIAYVCHLMSASIGATRKALSRMDGRITMLTALVGEVLDEQDTPPPEAAPQPREG